MGFFRYLYKDIVHGDSFERSMAIFIVFLGLTMVSLFVSLPFMIAENSRHRKELIEDGCEVVGEHTTTILVPVTIGKITTFQHHQVRTETWSCPDGREFDL